MMTLRFTSLVSTIADPFCAAVATYVTARLPFAVEFVHGNHFAEREPLVDQQQIDLVWLCGLLYLKKYAGEQLLLPAVAPAMRNETPPDKAFYYGDIVVHAASPFQHFADLQGKVWTYNEEASFSGYQMVRAHLAQLGLRSSYFGTMFKSGAHLNSIAAVRAGRADCAAIDSTVLQMLRLHDAEQAADLRTIARLGPYPMPLWAFANHVSPATQSAITELLLHIHEDPTGQALLRAWAIERFFAVTTKDYAPIAEADRLAQQLDW